MEFINYTRRDAVSSSSGIKSLSSRIGLLLNLAPGKKEHTFSGIGTYLEADVKEKNTSFMVKIPFFSAYKKNNFINKNGINYINPLAKTIIKNVTKKKASRFDLAAFKTYKTNELNSRISALGTTPEDLALKTELENERDNVIGAAKLNDSQKLIKNEIKYLDNIIKQGLDLRKYSNDTARKAAIKSFCDLCEFDELLKVQQKNLTWKQKKGINKINNKITKRVGAGLLALSLAFTGVHFSGLVVKAKEVWNFITKGSKTKTTQIVPTEAPEVVATREPVVTVAPTLTEREPIITVPPRTTETEPKVTMAPSVSGNNTFNSEAYEIAYNSNMQAFSGLKELFDSRSQYYGFSFEDMIEAYTCIEHVHEITISANQIKSYLAAARTLVNLAIETGIYNQLPLREETFAVLQNCFDGNLESGIDFVRNSFDAKKPLLDVITIGETESNLLYGNQLLSFNNEVYFNILNKYISAISNGTFVLSETEIAKIKTLIG